MNGGSNRSMTRNPQTSKGLRRAATRKGALLMRRQFQVVVTVKINPATVILAIAALVKVLI
jgi:hypothetical protein